MQLKDLVFDVERTVGNNFFAIGVCESLKWVDGVVTDVVDQIREVCDPYLGESNTVEQRNAMSSQISKRLSKLMNDGEILYYAFDVLATIEQVLLGECSISLTLAVPQELRKITTVVALKAAV